MALSRILSPTLARRVAIISLLPLARSGRPAVPAEAGADGATITRRLPRRSGAGQAPGLLFCLAPQKVYRAPHIAVRAVGSYPAFSPLPEAARGCAGRYILCDTVCRAGLSPVVPADSPW